MESKNITDLVDRINKIQSNATGGVFQDQAARANLLQTSRELTTALERPDEVVSRVGYISGGGNMCVRLAIDLKLFEQLALAEHPMTAEELAKDKYAEPALVRRILRVLAGMGFVAEALTADRKPAFVPTAITKHMTKPSVKAGIRFFYDQGFPILSRAPEYFRANGYLLPQGQSDGPFNFAHDTLEDCFTYWSKQDGVMENFNVFMNGVFGAPARLHWTDWFPFEAICFSGFDPRIGGSEFTWVDVGGGKGHHVQQLVDKYPNVQGKFAVQDLAFVIDDVKKSQISLSSRIELMKHNFLEPQPINGARTYWMANILHNWADPVCNQILSNLKEAMVPGYSKLLVADIVIPEQNVPLRQSGLDIAMLFLHSGSQKTAPESQQLIESAGFKVNKIWLPPGDGDAIVEAELPLADP